MNMKTVWAVGLLIVLLAAGAYAYVHYHPGLALRSVSSGDQAAVEAAVTAFGGQMKMVSLLAPDVKAQIQAQYGAYITPELLAAWTADPSKAPGRKTSSPWPEKINIASTTKVTDAIYGVQGNVVEVTSAATSNSAATQPVAVYPVSLRVENRGRHWLIASFEAGAYSQLPQSTATMGKWECLPHKNTSGPQTLECAFGILKDGTTQHYAIDASLVSSTPVDFATGTHVKIEGIVTPVEQLNALQIYNITGVIRATSITKI